MKMKPDSRVMEELEKLEQQAAMVESQIAARKFITNYRDIIIDKLLEKFEVDVLDEGNNILISVLDLKSLADFDEFCKSINCNDQEIQTVLIRIVEETTRMCILHTQNKVPEILNNFMIFGTGAVDNNVVVEDTKDKVSSVIDMDYVESVLELLI